MLAVVDEIPPGFVMSYGDVAAAFGSRSARGVGRVMAHAGGEVPWWRVVRASGHPVEALAARALEHYRAEGTPLAWAPSGAFRIDMRRARWAP